MIFYFGGEKKGKPMTSKSKMITLPCDCRCCMFVIKKAKWEDGDVNYNITVQDSRYDHNFNTPWGRIKRACRALFGKPVCFNDVHIEDEEKFRALIKDMTDLLDNDVMSK